MQIVVFDTKTGELVLHSGPYALDTNHIVKMDGIVSVTYNQEFYEAKTSGGEVKLRVPMSHTNVIYK
jgi:hypothetical protein